MARRSAKKKTAPQSCTPAAPAPTPTPDGATLLADLEQRCVSLRDWHQQASATLETREEQLNEQAAKLAKQQKALDKTNAQLNKELNQLADVRKQVEIDRNDLTELRRDLEAEWSALRNLRDAQAKLGQELDAERQRLNRRAFKLTTPAPTELPKLNAA